MIERHMATLYQDVIDALLQRIASGALPPGAMLPSEVQLGKELGVAQGTARKAVMELEARGLIQRTQGRGSFVTLRTPEESLFSFFQLRRPDGTMDPPGLLSETLKTRPAKAGERETLHDAPETVYELTRARTLGGDVSVVETSVLSTALFPGLADRGRLPNTLYVFLQQAYSTIILRTEETLRAVPAGKAVAKRLGVAPGDPLLAITRHTYDALDRVVEVRTSHCRTDKHAYFAFRSRST